MSVTTNLSVSKTKIFTSCAFYGDLYPNEECYDTKIADGLKLLLGARKKFAYGTQRDYFQEHNCIGFAREGDGGHGGCAVLISNAANESGLAFPMFSPQLHIDHRSLKGICGTQCSHECRKCLCLSCPLGAVLIQFFSVSASVPRNTEGQDTDRCSRIPPLISTLTRMVGRRSPVRMARSKYGALLLQRLRHIKFTSNMSTRP